ncbi:MAG: DUF4401 domain-containing protein [Anaerolineae bacterium]
MNTQPTLRSVIDQLVAESFAIPEEYEQLVTRLKIEKKEAGSPWYVRLFAGLSAWIAAVFFISFLFEADILQNEESGMVLGLLFCAIAVGLNRRGPRNGFWGQLGLALSLSGQVLFIMGLGRLWDEVVPVALALISLEILLIWAYQDRLHRFIATVVVTGAILTMIVDTEFYEAVHLLILALAAGVFLRFRRESDLLVSGWDELARPLGYGAAVSLLGVLILPLVEEFDVQWWWITAVLLLVVLLFLVSQIAADLGLSLGSGAMTWLLAGCVALLAPAVRTPGILGAFLLLLLGFWRSNRLLAGLAAVFLLFYLGAYYYSLEWTLLVKSFALIATGAILFLLRFILLRFNRGGAL